MNLLVYIGKYKGSKLVRTLTITTNEVNLVLDRRGEHAIKYKQIINSRHTAESKPIDDVGFVDTIKLKVGGKYDWCGNHKR